MSRNGRHGQGSSDSTGATLICRLMVILCAGPAGSAMANPHRKLCMPALPCPCSGPLDKSAVGRVSKRLPGQAGRAGICDWRGLFAHDRPRQRFTRRLAGTISKEQMSRPRDALPPTLQQLRSEILQLCCDPSDVWRVLSWGARVERRGELTLGAAKHLGRPPWQITRMRIVL